MSVKRKRYSKQFKLDTIQMYENGEKSMALVERELGITEGLLAKWRDDLQRVKDPASAFPANDLASVQIHHHCQVQPAFPRRNIGDIRHPFFIGRFRLKFAVQQVRCHWICMSAIGGDHFSVFSAP